MSNTDMEHAARIRHRALALLGLLWLLTPLVAQSRMFLVPAEGGLWTLSAAGDVNGDGHPDVVVGMPYNACYCNGNVVTGLVRVYSGRDMSILHEIRGSRPGDQLGQSVAGVGDINKDGRADFAVGDDVGFTPDKKSYPGSALVYSGRDATVLFALYGDTSGDRFGDNIASLGDVDNDGYPDFGVAARYDSNTFFRAGSVKVFSGKTGKALYTLNGTSSSSLFGASIGALGDLDDDGCSDFFVGATFEVVNNVTLGSLTVFSGKAGKQIYKLFGRSAGDWFGIASAIGDVDRDGKVDLVVGASQGLSSTGGPGYAQVISGKTGKQLFKDLVGDSNGDQFSASTGLGDVNKDGYPDFAVSAPSPGRFGPSGAGYVRVFSGKDATALSTLTGDPKGMMYGSWLAGLGDLNLDGTPDFGVTGLLPPVTPPTRLYIYSGRNLSLTTDVHELSLQTAGQQTMTLDAGTAHANRTYWVFGSVTGTQTGINLGSLTLPLDYDPYTTFTLTSPNSAVFPNSVGRLDASGKATAAFKVPSGLPPLQGLTLFHAYLVFDSRNQWVMASNAAPLRLY